MKFSLRLIASVALLASVGLIAGCGSNNKGKIEGRWKIVSMPEKSDAKNKNEVAEMNKLGMYVYMDFKPDGGLTFGLGAEKEEVLNFVKGMAPNQKITWDAKYKLLNGDSVEFYDLPKDLQTGGSGLFGNKDKAKVTVKITGDDMALTDDTGTAKLTKIK